MNFFLAEMEIEDIATVMLLAPDMFDDEELLMLLLAETEATEPVHYKYDRFDKNTVLDEEFKLYFRFEKDSVRGHLEP